MKAPITEKTREEIAAIADETGCRLLAVETAGTGRYTILRLVLERSDGGSVSVDDCERVSREVSPLLDATDEIGHKYTLEVSSAGLDRKLYSIDDALRFVGQRIRVKTENPVTPERVPGDAARERLLPPARNFAGVLSRVDGDTLAVVDEAEGRIYNVRFAEIRLARLDFEWPGRGLGR